MPSGEAEARRDDGGATLSGRAAGSANRWANQARQNGRTPAVIMAAFLAGILLAALVIPAHRSLTTGSVGLGGAGGSEPGSGAGGSAAGSPGGLSTGVGGSAAGSPGGLSTGSGGTSLPGTGASALGPGGSSGSGSGSAISGVTGTGSSNGSGLPGGAGPTGSVGEGGARNSGASAQGVTATSIKLGVLGGSSTTIGPACPRCDQGGQATDEAVVKGLLALWHKQGKLPVYGRDINPVFTTANDLDTTGASAQAACEQLGGQTIFASLVGIGAGGDDCLVTSYHSFVFDAGGGDTLPGHAMDYPYYWQIGSSIEQALTAWASWANANGLLKGHTIGLYAPDDTTDSGIQEVINATFKVELAKLGHPLKVDETYSGEGQSNDAVAVEKMRAQGVDVVFIWNGITEPSGFQNQADQIGYHPLYPMVDAGSFPYDDSLADVAYKASDENGNLGLATRWWDWSVRKPATAVANPAAQQCVDAYEQETGTTIDVYNDDAKLRYMLDECADLQVILQGLQNAGPDLTKTTFVHGLEQIANMQTADYQSVSLTGGPLGTGDNYWQTAQFKQNRWQPTNDYWGMLGRYESWSVFPDDAATVAAAVKEGQ